jgi:hypothetical protein
VRSAWSVEIDTAFFESGFELQEGGKEIADMARLTTADALRGVLEEEGLTISPGWVAAFGCIFAEQLGVSPSQVAQYDEPEQESAREKIRAMLASLKGNHGG